MFSSDRDEYRKVFFEAWKKYKSEHALTPLEMQLVEIMLSHPEYHAVFENSETNQEKDFDSANPFLHISLHLGVREQVSTNRPSGIRDVYQQLCEKYHDVHIAEHKMMEFLGKILWDAQQNGAMPDEAEYLEGLKRL